MRLKIFLLGILFSTQSFSSENIMLNFNNNTDEQTLSYAIFLQSINKYSCLPSLSDSKIASFTENNYRATCMEKAKENGKELKDANGKPLYYTTCEFYVYASPKCTGNKIGTISLDRGARSNKYVNEAAIKNISQLSVRTRNDDEYGSYNNRATKGYILLKSKNKERIDINIQNAIYYMVNNKSRSSLTIGVNSPCDALKIGNIDMPPLSPGSIWSIPNFWLYDKCSSSGICRINIYEVSNRTCGNIIGTIEVDLNHKKEELITLDDYSYQLSLQPYLRTSFEARRAITIQ